MLFKINEIYKISKTYFIPIWADKECGHMAFLESDLSEDSKKFLDELNFTELGVH